MKIKVCLNTLGLKILILGGGGGGEKELISQIIIAGELKH